jgi:hypothetical protein
MIHRSHQSKPKAIKKKTQEEELADKKTTGNLKGK